MSRRHLLATVWAALLTAVAAAAEGADGGTCEGNAGPRLSVSSNYNASGHWRTTLHLEMDAPVGRAARPGRHVQLDVQPSSRRCGGVRTDAITITLHGPLPPPSPGYEELAGYGFYKIHTQPSSWMAAKAACESEGTHLLVLNSEAESRAIREFIARNPNTGTWPHIGIWSKEKDGNFTTIFGETLADAGFAVWSAGEPNNAGNDQYCGGITKQAVFVDNGCTLQNEMFICEQDI